MKYRIYFLFACVLFISCGHNSYVERELDRAKNIMRSHPDSALQIIEHISPDDIVKRGTRAKYALLYSQALDKNYEDIDNDSLISIAYRYYNKRMCSDSLKFLLNYQYGRVCQNAEDYQAAIRYYLVAESYARSAMKNYFLGIVNSQIGEVYSEQMNYNGMLEYHLKAYDHFKNLKNTAFKNNALVSIANAYSRLKDYENATLYYDKAIAMAQQRGDGELASICLSNMGAIYASTGDYQRVKETVKNIQKTAPDALSVFEYKLLSVAFYQQHQIDSARYYMSIAQGLVDDIRDDAMLKYLSFQIEMAASNYDKAEDNIEDYIALSDSISRMMLYQSAATVESKYYKEQSAFASYRLKSRTLFGFIVFLLIFVMVGFMIYYYRQRVRQNQLQIERYMSAIDDIRISKERVVARLEAKEGVEEQLKELVLSRFEFLDQLGRAFYERNTTKAQQEAIYKQVKNFISDLSSNSATKKELERIINTVNGDITVKLRNQLPRFKPADIDLLIYIYAGFSAQIISVIIDDSVANVYHRKSRLRARILSSNAPDKDLFLRNMP